MASRTSGGKTPRSGGSSGARKTSSNGASSNGRVGAMQVIRHAKAQVKELTGRPVEGVLGVRRGDDGGWEALVEVVELRRVPDSTDVLASYLLLLDDRGEVQEYRRTRRYYRNQVEEE
jgi:hypothetical protein